MAARPKNNAIVDTISKYRRDFQLILPTCLRLECPAMPTTSVPNSNGAMIVLTRFRKILLRKFRDVPAAGKSFPNSAPATIPIRIQVVRDLLSIP